ncbi:MAG: hypothetical protein JNJ41_00645 [Bacteroidia bacterium]|nr:hypothetical protein [Bacteroidia bacterium]
MKSKIHKGLNKLASFKTSRWKNNGGKKVLIAVNQYFSNESWTKLFSGKYSNEVKDWDVVFSSGKLDFSKHFAEADVCFLFGYSKLNQATDSKPKLLYFPLIGLEFLNDRKIPANYQIEKPPAYSKMAIAEYCFSMAVLIRRNLQFSFTHQYEKRWEQKEILTNDFKPISSEKIGILGLGNVGRAVADYFKQNSCEVIGCDRIIDHSFNNIDQWFTIEDLNAFLKLIDVLIIALPLTEETKNLVGINELKVLGKNKYLINISRGEIVNEKELLKALSTEMIGGAVLDVFAQEPLSSSSPFYKLKNVIITPHIAGNINLFVSKIQADFIQKASSNK